MLVWWRIRISSYLCCSHRHSVSNYTRRDTLDCELRNPCRVWKQNIQYKEFRTQESLVFAKIAKRGPIFFLAKDVPPVHPGASQRLRVLHPPMSFPIGSIVAGSS